MWRIKVEAKDGTFKHYRTSDQIRSGDLVLSLNPGLLVVDGRAYWSLRDARFDAIPASVGIQLHDWVEFQVKASDYQFWGPAGVGLRFDDTGQWVILGRGEALNAGDLNNEHTRISFTPTPGETRLKKTYIPTTEYPQQEAAHSLQQAIQDVLTTGQLGTAIRYDSGFLPSSGVIVGKRVPNAESLNALMTALTGQVAQQKQLEGDSREWKWGTTQTGHVFMGPVDSGKLTLDEREEEIGIEFLGMQGADTCTAVYWFVRLPQGDLPGRTLFKFDDGTPLFIQGVGGTDLNDDQVYLTGNTWDAVEGFYHLSQQNPSDTSLHTLALSRNWVDARFMVRPAFSLTGSTGTYSSPEAAVDGDATTPTVITEGGPVYKHTFSDDYYPVQVKLTYECSRDWTDGLLDGDPSAARMLIRLAQVDGGVTSHYVDFEWFLNKTTEVGGALDRTFVTLLEKRIPDMTYNTFMVIFDVLEGTTLKVFDLQLEYVRFSLLDGLAREHWVTPVQNAGEARVSNRLALPVAFMDLVKEDGTTLPDIPVELVEWTIGGSELKTVFKFGEVDPRRSQVLANEALRKQRVDVTGTSAVVTATGGD